MLNAQLKLNMCKLYGFKPPNLASNVLECSLSFHQLVTFSSFDFRAKMRHKLCTNILRLYRVIRINMNYSFP